MMFRRIVRSAVLALEPDGRVNEEVAERRVASGTDGEEDDDA